MGAPSSNAASGSSTAAGAAGALPSLNDPTLMSRAFLQSAVVQNMQIQQQLMAQNQALQQLLHAVCRRFNAPPPSVFTSLTPFSQLSLSTSKILCTDDDDDDDNLAGHIAASRRRLRRSSSAHFFHFFFFSPTDHTHFARAPRRA